MSGEGEVYVRADGKKVRRIRKATTSSTPGETVEIITRPDGTRVRRIKRLKKKANPKAEVEKSNSNASAVESTTAPGENVEEIAAPEPVESTTAPGESEEEIAASELVESTTAPGENEEEIAAPEPVQSTTAPGENVEEIAAPEQVESTTAPGENEEEIAAPTPDRWTPPKPTPPPPNFKPATDASPWLVGRAAPAKRAPSNPHPTISFSTASTAARAIPWKGRPNSSAAMGFKAALAKNTANNGLSENDQLKRYKQNWNARKLPQGKVSDRVNTYKVLLHVPRPEDEAKADRLVETGHVNLALKKRRQEERKAVEKMRILRLDREIRRNKNLLLPMAVKIQAQVRRRKAQRLAQKKRELKIQQKAAGKVLAERRREEAMRLKVEAERSKAAIQLQAFCRGSLTRARVAVVVDRVIADWVSLEAKALATAEAHGLVNTPAAGTAIASA